MSNRVFRWVLILSAIVLLALLFLYHQPYYPPTWLDEGFSLQGALNLLRYHEYAMKSSEGFRVLDQPLIANGPGVVLPITAMFSFFGIGLLQARLVVALFAIVAVLTVWVIAKKLGGTGAALLSCLFLLALPQEGFVLYARMATGNVPSVCYFLIGVLLWIRFLETRRSLFAIISGLFWGLSIVTKGQYFLLFPTLAVVMLADLLYYHQASFKTYLIVIGLVVGALALWNLVQVVIVGWDNIAQHYAAIRANSQLTVFALRPSRIPGSLFYLIRSGMFLVILPALLYAALAAYQRNRLGLIYCLFGVFIAGWLSWYAFVSVGWPRYSFDAYVIATIPAGKFVAECIRLIWGKLSIPTRLSQWGSPLRVAAAVFIVSSGIVAGVNLYQQINAIVTKANLSAFELAAQLETIVGPEAVVESWEWEIDVLAPLNYHHPTDAWVNKMTAVLQYNDPLPETYDIYQYQPSYLINGPTSKGTGIYDKALADGCCILIYHGEHYDLYEVKAR